MKTIQEIEKIDISTLSEKERLALRRNLDVSFYHTSTHEKLSDGRCAKDVIGNERERFILFGMEGKK